MRYMIQTPNETRIMRASRAGAEAVAITRHQATGQPVTVWSDRIRHPDQRLPHPRLWSLVLHVTTR